MALNLPVQGVIYRRRQPEPFLVRTAFEDDDGTPSVMEHEIGGAHGHDPRDPGPWFCAPAMGFGCDTAAGADPAGAPDIL
ncbi:hypothetical protein GT045_31860 [Streptomyces sp. SID486]|uniref:hypothetical protein n=1 Tax=unclassified Streptomyces TaxID=2593676 RepID=UPI00136D9D92|nr:MULTISPECIES: hypothetical protein [unclassified Streptomyces]MYW14421.1 hypothetical protein [Streptomyces sp. SID2955]MYW48348.1 hypothetical protein [Streptomyces sp. SID161]MYX99274.1 hypothetical protein [Streptomyces sp. SID486]